MTEHICPYCGGDISNEIEAAAKAKSARGGAAKTILQTEAHKVAMAKARAAANSPEKLAAKQASMTKAREVRMAKLAAKKQTSEN